MFFRLFTMVALLSSLAQTALGSYLELQDSAHSVRPLSSDQAAVSSAPQSTLLSLPDELLVQILGCGLSARDLASCRLSCKQLKVLVGDQNLYCRELGFEFVSFLDSVVTRFVPIRLSI